MPAIQKRKKEIASNRPVKTRCEPAPNTKAVPKNAAKTLAGKKPHRYFFQKSGNADSLLCDNGIADRAGCGGFLAVSS